MGIYQAPSTSISWSRMSHIQWCAILERSYSPKHQLLVVEMLCMQLSYRSSPNNCRQKETKLKPCLWICIECTPRPCWILFIKVNMPPLMMGKIIACLLRYSKILSQQRKKIKRIKKNIKIKNCLQLDIKTQCRLRRRLMQLRTCFWMTSASTTIQTTINLALNIQMMCKDLCQ